jgi:hypothetical protein
LIQKLLELLFQQSATTTKEIVQQVNLSSTPCMKEDVWKRRRHQEISVAVEAGKVDRGFQLFSGYHS